MSLNKFTDVAKGKELNLQIGCATLECVTCICDNIVVPAGGDITAHSIYVQNDLKVQTSNGDVDYTTPNVGLPNYVLHTDGLGATFWATDATTDLNTKTQNLSLLTTPLNTIHSGLFETDNVKVNEALDLTNQPITPSLPALGDQKLYFKNDQNLYKVNSAGVETIMDSAGLYLPLAGGTMTGNITNLQTNDTKIHLGDNAGAIAQGVRAVAIGEFSGNDTQGLGGVAIGSYCAPERQGANAIAIGNNAGYTDQSIDCIALGRQTGQLNQGIGSIALGLFSGNNNQATRCVAIGYDAGTTTQGLNSVALGNRCGNAGQGTYAVAIGNASGELNQHASSLLINAHNVALNSTASNQIILQAGTSTLQYDATALSIAGAIVPTGGNLLVTGGVYVGNANRPVMSGGYSQIAQVTISNTVVETTLIDITGAVGTLSIPANTMRVGSTSKFFIAGLIDTTSASQDITLRIKSGTTTLSTFAVTTGTNLNAGSSFTLEGNILVRTIGVTGSIITSAMFAAGNTGNQSFTRNNITTGVIDTTAINTFEFTVEWAIASVNNTITSQIISTQNVFQPIA